MKTARPIPPPAEVSTTADPVDGGLPMQPAGGLSSSCKPPATRLDYTGRVFGRLTVVGPAPNKRSPGGQTHRQWRCACRCGKQVVVQHGSLQQGLTRSCGCYANARRSEASTKYLSPGTRFGGLVVIRKNGRTEEQKIKWLCRCDCGKTRTVIGQLLRNGHTTSCGCLRTKHKVRPGDKYARLTVVRLNGHDGRGRAIWKCRCDCGATTASTAWQLYSGNKQSCGCLIRELVGPKHHNWDPSLTDEHRDKQRLRRELNQITGLSEKVFRRDDFTCLRCGQRGGRLAAHHIMPWAEYSTLRFRMENCVTLCADCHAEFHRVYGKKYCDDEDLAEYLAP